MIHVDNEAYPQPFRGPSPSCDLSLALAMSTAVVITPRSYTVTPKQWLHLREVIYLLKADTIWDEN